MFEEKMKDYIYCGISKIDCEDKTRKWDANTHL